MVTTYDWNTLFATYGYPTIGETQNQYLARIGGGSSAAIDVPVGSTDVEPTVQTGITDLFKNLFGIGNFGTQQVIGYGLLAYGAYRLWRTKRLNLATGGTVLAGLIMSGVMHKIVNYVKSSGISTGNLLSLLLPGKAGTIMNTAVPLASGVPIALVAIPAVAGIIKSLIFSRPKRRFYRRSYRPYRYSYARKYRRY